MYGWPWKKSMTESSARVRMGLSLESTRSARPASSLAADSSSRQMGAPETLPLVMTRQSGMVTPSS